jgi:hypothetical protein
MAAAIGKMNAQDETITKTIIGVANTEVLAMTNTNSAGPGKRVEEGEGEEEWEGEGEGTETAWAHQKGGVLPQREPSHCRKDAGRPLDGMFMLRVMNSIQLCKQSRQVQTSHLNHLFLIGAY